MRFCLLQARNGDDPSRDEERECFARQLGVAVEQVRQVDMLTSRPEPSLWPDHDALLVGGSGEYSVLDDHPAIQAWIDFLGETAERGHPTFASCFGFQMITLALGGQVAHDEENAEVGTFLVSLTSAARLDPLFRELPATFLAQEGHKDRATVLPAGVTHLASTPRAPFQAMRVGDGPVYATQFHPELDWEDQRRRFLRYFTMYSDVFGLEDAQRMADDFKPTPHSCGLLGRFKALIT